MDFEDVGQIQSDGFRGFETVENLRTNRCANVPSEAGVYLILRSEEDPPRFLKESRGGHFKRENPTVSVWKLDYNWIEGAIVIYIDKGRSLRKRIRQLIDYGGGKPVGHRGGRYVWQLAGSDSFVLCWKETPESDPRDEESDIIEAFKRQYGGHRPFANLQD